jgi:Ca-activated chloride channel family protein
MKIHYKHILLLLASVLSIDQSAEAGGKLYGRFPNQEHSPVFDLQLRKFTTTVEIQDQLAVVHVDETFYNDNASTLEGIYFFEMPEGSKLTEMALWIDGQRVEQVIKRREEAVQQYEQIVRRLTDPLLAEEVAENVFRLRLFPLPPRSERRLEIKYIQPLPAKSNAIEFFFPLRLQNYTAKHIDSAAIHLDFKSQMAVDSLWLGSQVPAETIRVTEISATHYLVDFKATQTEFEYDFSFYFRPKFWPLFNTIKYVPDNPADDGFYLNWVSPPARFFAPNSGPRQFVFCADVSVSMIGTRLSQLKQALSYFVDQLQPNDRFNVVAFNSEVSSFDSGLVLAEATNKSRAKMYIQTLSANGLTNLNAALLTALAMLDSSAGQSQVLLISDGQPTWGETRVDSILANVRRANKAGAAIFAVGLGSEVNKSFFQSLSQQNSAAAFFIDESENVTGRLVQIYNTVTSPILTNVEIVTPGIAAYDILPTTASNLSLGMQFLQVGRYVAPGGGYFQFRANRGQTAIDTSVVVDLSQAPDNNYVSRFWAAQKIQTLLQDIERLGPRQELIDAVVYLSIHYSVLSPYTAFLVIEPGSVSTAVHEESGGNLPRAFALKQNYPNPFSPNAVAGKNLTTISYAIPANIPAASVRVELKIYNLLGQLVKVLALKQQAPGEYEINWDGRDETGHVVPAGIYLVRLVAGNFVADRKVVVL